jgi:hypothetical protein
MVLAICLQLKRSANTGTSYMGGFSGFLRDQAATRYQLQKIAYTYRSLLNAVEQISNDIAKYRFPLIKNGNNRESKPNHPAHKLVSVFSNSLMTTFIFSKQWLFRCFCVVCVG